MDPSVLLALVRMEGCDHTNSYANVAACFDGLSKAEAQIIFSKLCLNQMRVSLYQNSNPHTRTRDNCNRYFSIIHEYLETYRRARLEETTKMSRRFVDKFWDRKSEQHDFRGADVFLHHHIARELGADTIITYDPRFLDLSAGVTEINRGDDGDFSMQYLENCARPELRVASPESAIGMKEVCV